MTKYYNSASIGSIPKIFMKLFEYVKNNKSILILDRDITIGENWKSVISGMKAIGYSCFVISNNRLEHDFLINQMKIEMPIFEYQPFSFYKNKKNPLNSQLLYSLLDYRKTKNFKQLFKIIVSFFKELYKIYINDYKTRYFKKVILLLFEKYQKVIKKYKIDVYNNETVEKIFVNFLEKEVYIESNNLKINASPGLIGAGINIEEIEIYIFDFYVLRNQRILNLFTFVHIKIKSKKKAKFYVDLTHINKNNDLKGTLLEKVDLYQATRTNYDKFKIVLRVTNISDFTSNLDENKIILSIDTNGWLPKEKYNKDMTILLVNFLKEQRLIEKDVFLLDYNWNKNEAKTIGQFKKLLIDYFNTYLLSTNSLSFTSNLRGE